MGIQGIIRPPPDIRAVADKTALFVAKNGRAFETRILTSAKGKTPKFAFLHSSSPFHAYYEDRIRFYAEGGNDAKKTKEEPKTKQGEDDKSTKTNQEVNNKDDDKGGSSNGVDNNKKSTLTAAKEESSTIVVANGENGSSQIVPQQQARKAKAVLNPVAKVLLAQRSILRNQSEKEEVLSLSNKIKWNYYTSLSVPVTATPVQVEIMKLTAQYTVLNGKVGGSFLRDLTQREWQTPQTIFGFLQPRHAHFAYFTTLVDIYQRILSKQTALAISSHNNKVNDDETQNGTNKKISLVDQVNLSKMMGINLIPEDEQNIKNDVCKVVPYKGRNNNNFGDGMTDEYSIHDELKVVKACHNDVNQCLEMAAYRTEYERYKEDQKRSEMEKNNDDDHFGGSANVDWHDFVVVETIQFDLDEIVQSVVPPPTKSTEETNTEIYETSKTSNTTTNSNNNKDDSSDEEEDDMDESSSEDEDDDEEEEKIHVVPNYTPKVVSVSQKDKQQIIDPITKRSINVEDMTEHMRIQLLDPKWAAEKKRFMDKQKETNLLQGDAIASNINRFAKARGGEDLSSFNDTEIPSKTQEVGTSTNMNTNPTVQMPQPSLPVVVASAPTTTNVVVEVPTPPPLPSTTATTAAVLPASTNDLYHSKPEMEEPVAKKVKTDGDTITPVTTIIPPPLPPTNKMPPFMAAPPPPPPPLPLGAIPAPPPPPPGIPIPLMMAPPPPPVMTQEVQNHDTTNDTNDENGLVTSSATSSEPIPEKEFVESLESPTIDLAIQVPKDSSFHSSWNLDGQIVKLSSIHVMKTIKDVKEQLHISLGGEMPINKMQMKKPGSGFAKDAHTLAFLNIGPDGLLELIPKIRGGRKK